jgi:hypothetical protein
MRITDSTKKRKRRKDIWREKGKGGKGLGNRP